MENEMVSTNEIPVIDLSKCSPNIHRGTHEWLQLCKRVREAGETYGCFEVVYDKISKQLRDETFALIRQVSELPLDTKKKNANSKPHHGYEGQIPYMPLFESTNIADASNYNSLKSFTELMWPDGHQQFNQIISSMVKELDELNRTISMLILDSYGVGENSTSIMECKTLFRMNKYKAPPNGEKTKEGMIPHVDKDMCTLLAGDGVPGLEIETKDGQWIKLFPSPTSFIFLVGDALMVWSNCRLHGVNHRVTISAEKERYAFGAFFFPLDETTIKPQSEFVDDDHPQMFEEFNYREFLNFSFTYEAFLIGSSKQVYAYAGN